MKLKGILISILTLTLLLYCQSFGAGLQDKKVVLRSIDFPGNHKEDGYWAALHAGADGKVYIGLNTEGGGHAHFYIYDPAKDEIRHRADMAEFLGGYGKGIRTHAKIHSKFCEDKEGNIYFATGNMGAGPDEVDPMSWEGGHWCKYDPKTDKLEDLGLVVPYRGIYGMAIDKDRNMLFGVCYGGHLLVHNISTGQTTDKGRVNLSGRTAARTLVCDDQGNVYGTFAPDRIFKYDSANGRVIDLGIRLPSDATIYPRTTHLIKRYMRAGVWDDVNKKIYGVEGGTSILFEFDPKVGKEGQIRALERLLPYQHSEKVRRSHYATLSFTIGLDRKVYYMPIGSMESNDCNKGRNFFRWVGQAYLITYDLGTGQKEILGRVFVKDGTRVIGWLNGPPSGGAATGTDGTIYFCGFVRERNPELISTYLGFEYWGQVTNMPARLRLLIYKP